MSTDAPLLVFMNNDVEMISTGWDTRLAGLLSRAEVGAVGARLTYPDGTLQHAGVVMGFGTVCDHDGRGEPGDAEGPLRRYVTRHSVTAVTGAFLAVRRETFQALGGFDDEALPLWFNDTDFCLKSWAAGLRVLYEPAISAVHHEAKTLGSAIAGKDRDDYFLSSARTMRARWGAAMDADRWSSPRFRRAIAPVLTIMR
jgi:GT2 family glycosyltransferase